MALPNQRSERVPRLIRIAKEVEGIRGTAVPLLGPAEPSSLRPTGHLIADHEYLPSATIRLGEDGVGARPHLAAHD